MLRYLILPIALFVCASAVNDPESGQPPEKKARICYFAAQKKAPGEKGLRPANSRTSTTCRGDFTELSRLALNTDGDLEGAPNELALILSRYEGIFLNETSDLSDWDGTYICAHHLAELSRKWSQAQFHHVVWDHGKKLCGHFDHALHAAYSYASFALTYEQSKRILEEKSVMMSAGLPLCDRHQKALTSSAALPIPAVKDEPSKGDAADVCYDDDKKGVKQLLADKSYKYTERAQKFKSPLQHHFEQLAKEAGATRFRCRKSFHELSYKGQWSKARVALLLEKVAVEQLAGESETAQAELSSLIRRLRDGKPTSNEDHETLVSILDGVAEEFRVARTTKEKVMVISLFARQIPYRVLSKYIDGLSERLFNEAKKKALDAKSYKEPSHTKERFNRVKLSHFISFITSSHIMVGLPWGEKRTKDSKGNVVYLPNYIRTTGLYETIDLYEDYMRQTGRADLLLSRSTTYRILKTLPAMKTTSMTCVDYFAASATNAFISIERMLEEFDALSLVDSTDVKYLKRAFEEIKHYLKGNFRLHLKTESVYSDTCLLWSLSDPKDTRLSAPTAKHIHKNRCPECKKMDETITGVQKLLDQLAKDVKEAELHKKIKEFQHEFGMNVERIYDLKAHHVRTIMAGKERDRLIAGLQDNQAFITLDYAQKYLPSFYRESQKLYFGKSGLRQVGGKLVQHSFVHLLKNDQTSTEVVEIIRHTLSHLHRMSIKEVHLRSDNAGKALFNA